MSGDQASKSSERLLHHLRSENQTLLDQISILKLQCKTYEEETRKTIEKLSCLKLLVKRAWCGDEEASTHVANIVGVAAPFFEFRNDQEIIIIPKSRALNNWASLSTSLLERFYKQRDDILFLKKREFLLERENYLDSQLDENYVNEARANQQTLELLLSINKRSSAESDSFEKMKPQQSGYSFRRLTKKKSTRKIQCEPSMESIDGLLVEPCSFKEEKMTNNQPLKVNITRERPRTANNSRSCKTINTKELKPEQRVSKNSSMAQISRHKSARTVQTIQKNENVKVQRRPYSAQVGAKYMTIASSKNYDSYSRNEAVRELNVVEKELRKTTALLQKKLSINPLNFVQ